MKLEYWTKYWISEEIMYFIFAFLSMHFFIYQNLSFLKYFKNKTQLLFLNKLSEFSSTYTVLTKLKISGRWRYKNSTMVTLLGNSNFPKCWSSKATERVSNILNEATVTLSCLQHGFVTRKICEANPDFTRKYQFGIFYCSLRNINYPWLFKGSFWCS